MAFKIGEQPQDRDLFVSLDPGCGMDDVLVKVNGIEILRLSNQHVNVISWGRTPSHWPRGLEMDGGTVRIKGWSRQ